MNQSPIQRFSSRTQRLDHTVLTDYLKQARRYHRNVAGRRNLVRLLRFKEGLGHLAMLGAVAQEVPQRLQAALLVFFFGSHARAGYLRKSAASRPLCLMMEVSVPLAISA